MIVKLGYVSLSKALNGITTSKTITYTNYEKESFSAEKIIQITKSNLSSLKEILLYNARNNIHFYRLTSKLVPLATHDNVKFKYDFLFKKEFEDVGNLINETKIRVDTHPDQYAVLNSTNKKIVDNTLKILNYHYEVLKLLKIKYPLIILHVGSSACGKKASITRFINNFNALPDYLKKCIALENDDKVYNIVDVLNLCRILNIPMVLDYHHYVCNNNGERLEDYIKDIIDTWHELEPKFHFSSPKSKLKREFRSHNDYIDSNDFINFINLLKTFDKTFYIMLEAKAKDDALFRLVRELKYKTNYNFIDETSFENKI